ncbi:hypothetical protein BDA96_02G284700 [Sorghum bicolor]|uniref:Uncharacterized protein n=2 Tax=Sorghum bicolor TaxID=4558 RepID=A0A921RS94_SORBI|nr:hypothetical protein BDA96_02G284700 [Sorghum bicolor]OQU89799.1 hypothetical protein SORBI_3002G270766 [Sorghum bicolor]
MDQRQKFPTKCWISHSYIPVGRNATRREAPPSWRKQTQIRPVHGDRLTAPGTIASNTATPHGAMSSAHPQIEWKLATWRTTTRGLPYLPRPCRTGPGKSYGSRRRARGGRSPLLSSPGSCAYEREGVARQLLARRQKRATSTRSRRRRSLAHESLCGCRGVPQLLRLHPSTRFARASSSRRHVTPRACTPVEAATP